MLSSTLLSTAITGTVTVVLGMTLLLTACRDASAPAPEPTPTPTLEPTVEATMTPDRDEAAAEGQAMSRSDVSEIPDLPIRKGEAVFFPRERATQLGEMAGFDPSNVDDSRYATFRIDESQVIEFRGVVANIDAEGRFPVDVPVGDYLVCLANTFPDHTTGPPYTVVGCDVIELHDSADLIVSFGEGGVEVSLN